MKVRLECLECVVKQARRTADFCGADAHLTERILKEVMRRLSIESIDQTPAEHSMIAYEVAMELSGVADPYAEAKRRYNTMILDMSEALTERIRSSSHPLRTAAKLAIVGNVIDLGIGIEFDIHAEVERILETALAIDHFERFECDLESARSLFYLCDNAGELVFDKIFMATLREHCPDLAITAVVRSGPIINDATLEDAKAIGLDEIATVISSGIAFIGMPRDRISAESRQLLEESDIVISKGQGNFETVTEFERPVYFLLMAKCNAVASEMDVSFGDLVFLRR